MVLGISIDYTVGDTYLQRYDCLKTYPRTIEDTQTMVEIVSFLCETSINIDGRYDRNREILPIYYDSKILIF